MLRKAHNMSVCCEAEQGAQFCLSSGMARVHVVVFVQLCVCLFVWVCTYVCVCVRMSVCVCV